MQCKVSVINAYSVQQILDNDNRVTKIEVSSRRLSDWKATLHHYPVLFLFISSML